MRRTLFAVLSCAACYTPPPTVTVAPVELAASYDRTWDAVVQALAEQGIPVATIDKASGVLTSAPVKVESVNASRWGHCGSDPAIPMRVTDATVSVLVRGTATATTVRLSPRWSMVSGENAMVCATTGVWERELEAQIRTRLAR